MSGTTWRPVALSWHWRSVHRTRPFPAKSHWFQGATVDAGVGDLRHYRAQHKMAAVIGTASAGRCCRLWAMTPWLTGRLPGWVCAIAQPARAEVGPTRTSGRRLFLQRAIFESIDSADQSPNALFFNEFFPLAHDSLMECSRRAGKHHTGPH